MAKWLRICLLMQEMQVLSPGWEDPLEKKMGTDSSILAWEIPRTEEPVGYSPQGGKELDRTQHLNNDKQQIVL